MKTVVSERKDIAFFMKMYPLPMHKDAYAKSKAIVCEKSIKMLEDAYAKKPLPAPKCDTKAVDETIALAQKLGINGTPAMIMPDGSLVSGAVEAASIIQMIDKK